MDEFLIRAGLSPELVEALRLGVLGRLILAAFLGGLIGLEREVSGKAAGLRTNLLICVGAALLTELSVGIASIGATEVGPGVMIQGDPTRIAAQIVSGIGFLGAGTIIQSRGSIRGLTTAATIWVVAAIGMAVGSQSYVIAIGGSVLVVVALVLLGRLEDLLFDRHGQRRYVVVLVPSPAAVQEVEQIFRGSGLKLRTASIDKAEGSYEGHFEVEGPRRGHEAASIQLLSTESVLRTSRVG